MPTIKGKKLYKPSFYISDVRSNGNIHAYITNRFGLCLVSSTEELYLIKDRHSPKHGPYSPSELHAISSEELADIPKLEQSLQKLAASKKTWLRGEHIADLNKGIDWLELDCFIESDNIDARP